MRRWMVLATLAFAALFAGAAPSYAGDVAIDNSVRLDPFDPVPQIGFHHDGCYDPCGYRHRGCNRGCYRHHDECDRECNAALWEEREALRRYEHQSDTYDMIMQMYVDQLRWWKWQYRDGGHGVFHPDHYWRDYDGMWHDGPFPEGYQDGEWHDGHGGHPGWRDHDGHWHDGPHDGDADHHDGGNHDGDHHDGDGHHDGDHHDGDGHGDGDHHDGDHHDGDGHSDSDHHDGDHHDGDHHDGDGHGDGHHDGGWYDESGNWHDGPPPDHGH